MNLRNKVVAITGASKGLGKALAEAFAEKGARLAICARNKEALQQVEENLVNLGAEVLAVCADASVQKDVERFVSLIEKKYERLDVLINNASMIGPSPMPLLADFPSEDFDEVLATNTRIPFLMTQRVLAGMLQRNEGSIINVTSEAGKVGYAGWGAYGISKFAVEGMTYTWADELSDTDVRINMVDPGEMDTEMHEQAVPDCDYFLKKPEEIVDTFLYLASDEAKSVHGKRIDAEAFMKGRVLHGTKLGDL